jgi:5-methylcytosine-specific restriction endonuclease McrA
MSTYYSVGCIKEKAHVCDYCEIDDGRQTLYWEGKDFDICQSCLSILYITHNSNIDKKNESVVITRKRITEELRDQVFNKSGGQCVLCKSKEKLQVDHILPFSVGGKTTIENLQALCKKCNLIKRATI